MTVGGAKKIWVSKTIPILCLVSRRPNLPTTCKVARCAIPFCGIKLAREIYKECKTTRLLNLFDRGHSLAVCLRIGICHIVHNETNTLHIVQLAICPLALYHRLEAACCHRNLIVVAVGRGVVAFVEYWTCYDIHRVALRAPSILLLLQCVPFTLVKRIDLWYLVCMEEGLSLRVVRASAAKSVRQQMTFVVRQTSRIGLVVATMLVASAILFKRLRRVGLPTWSAHRVRHWEVPIAQ